LHARNADDSQLIFMALAVLQLITSGVQVLRFAADFLSSVVELLESPEAAESGMTLEILA
jgi:hypothetical protein